MSCYKWRRQRVYSGLGGSSTRADANIKGCQAAIDEVRASVDAHGLQLGGYINNMSSSLDNLG